MVIEPRSLVREALVSLMVSRSYQIVGDIASTADIDDSLRAEKAPRLVLLGTLQVDEVAGAADAIRRRWPEAKIILLFDHASSCDYQKLLASEIDGCIPLFASPDTLIDTLQRIMAADLRIMVLKSEVCSPLPCAATRGQDGDGLSLVSSALSQSDDPGKGITACRTPLPVSCGLSQREEEILKNVVRGHSNKMIARACGVTDATIKVHMKSILRKLRVANRTQAAVWALERGYGAEANHPVGAVSR
jgi:two-component system nitrate/nitrite response regulator NarL